TCLLCGGTTTADFAKEEGAAGRMGRQLVAVCVIPADGTRTYRAGDLSPDLQPEPDSDIVSEELPFHPQYLQLSRYGFTTFERLFTLRQRQLLKRLLDSLPEICDEMVADGADDDYAEALRTYLAFLIDRIAMRNSSFSFWHAGGQKVEAATSTNY